MATNNGFNKLLKAMKKHKTLHSDNWMFGYGNWFKATELATLHRGDDLTEISLLYFSTLTRDIYINVDFTVDYSSEKRLWINETWELKKARAW